MALQKYTEEMPAMSQTLKEFSPLPVYSGAGEYSEPFKSSLRLACMQCIFKIWLQIACEQQ